MSANPQVKNKSTVSTESKLYYRNDRIGASNYSFFYQKKIFENFRIALTSMGVNTIYIAKLRRFKYPDIIHKILIKITNVIILPTNIKTFFQKCIKPNTYLKVRFIRCNYVTLVIDIKRLQKI